MCPERVSVGEEGEGHSVLTDRRGAGTKSGESGSRIWRPHLPRKKLTNFTQLIR